MKACVFHLLVNGLIAFGLAWGALFCQAHNARSSVNSKLLDTMYRMQKFYDTNDEYRSLVSKYRMLCDHSIDYKGAGIAQFGLSMAALAFFALTAAKTAARVEGYKNIAFIVLWVVPSLIAVSAFFGGSKKINNYFLSLKNGGACRIPLLFGGILEEVERCSFIEYDYDIDRAIEREDTETINFHLNKRINALYRLNKVSYEHNVYWLTFALLAVSFLAIFATIYV